MSDQEKTREELLNEIRELRQVHAQCQVAQFQCRIAEETLRSSESRFRSVANSAVDAIVSINSKDEIIFWNPAASKIFGYSEEEVLGKSVTLLIPERLRAAHTNGVRRYAAGDSAVLIGNTVELQGMRKSGAEFPLELSLSTWQTNEGIFFTGIMRDITSRKMAEKALEHRTEEARQRSRELESLIHMVAHDLKSPVIAVGGFVRRLKKYLGDLPQDEERNAILEQLQSTCATMEDFLRDLLDGIALEHTEPAREPVLLQEVVHEVIQEHHQAAGRKGIIVEAEIAEPLPPVLGDRRRIKQVLDNLVANAIRHMGDPPEPLIRVVVSVAGHQITTRIVDNGIGIPAEHRDKIFERFFRVPKSGGEVGTGLGLSIVKSIVESHGGRIWVESEEDRGAEFAFTLPISSAESFRHPTSEAALPDRPQDILNQRPAPGCTHAPCPGHS